MTTIRSDVGFNIGTSFEYAPKAVAKAAAELVEALGEFANKLNISYDHDGEGISIRFPRALAPRAKLELEKAGVEKRNSGIRDLFYFKSVEVLISPYAGARPAQSR